MGDWVIEPGRIITKFSEISDVVNATRANMNEPALNGKDIATHIIPAQEFPQILQRITRKTPVADKGVIDNNYVDALYVQDPLIHSFFYIFMKQNYFSEIFYSYFHELGHIATHDLPSRKITANPDNLVVCEMLADSFAGWAVEEYNAAGPRFCFEPPLPRLLEEAKAMMLPENMHLSTPTTRITIASMLHLYISQRMGSFKGLYHFIRDHAVRQDSLDLLRVK
ncbi:MAG TPA: hypothetical protein HA362_04025 [Nanoarchaeota archaeon]|nr:hypothetical protein [Nanoarchaeota archaeon]